MAKEKQKKKKSGRGWKVTLLLFLLLVIGSGADGIRIPAGLRGQIWADAAFQPLTIQKYFLRAAPCLSPNLLRGNCEAPVS